MEEAIKKVGEQVKLPLGRVGFEQLQVRDQGLVAPRLARLPLQRTDLPFHLADEVGDAQKVLIGVFELAQGFPLLRFEFGDARGFFKNHPAVFRLAGQNLRDVALRHDAVAGASDARAHEQLLNVLQPARSLVDEILAVAIAKDPARQCHLVVSHLDAGGDQVFVIHAADGQRHFRHAKSFATIGAGKNHIGHLAATQGLGRLFAQNPANGIGNIRFAAPVRTDNRGNTRLKIERSLVREGLETQHC